MSSFIKS